MARYKKTIIKAVFIIAVLILTVVLFIDLLPLFKEVIKNRSDESRMVEYIKVYGAKGVPALIGLQILQVITTFFPSAAIQVLAGLCYGVLFGSLICITGYIIGNVLVFVTLRQFKGLFSPVVNEKNTKSKKNKYINMEKISRMKNPEFMAFILYLMPGVPNGILPYIFAQTKISFTRYLLTVTFAAIPSVLLATWFGESIAERNYIFSAIIAGIALLVFLFLFLFRKKIISILNKEPSK